MKKIKGYRYFCKAELSSYFFCVCVCLSLSCILDFAPPAQSNTCVGDFNFANRGNKSVNAAFDQDVANVLWASRREGSFMGKRMRKRRRVQSKHSAEVFAKDAGFVHPP